MNNVTQVTDGHCTNIEVATAIDVYNAIAEDIGFVSIRIDFVIGCENRWAHMFLQPLSPLSTVVETVGIFRIFLEHCVNCHRHVEGDPIVLVCLMDEIWYPLQFSLYSILNRLQYLYRN
jgi:hypothetical protein